MRPAEHGQDAAFTQRDQRFETIAYLPRYWNFESIPLQRRVIRTWITPTISKPHYPVAQDIRRRGERRRDRDWMIVEAIGTGVTANLVLRRLLGPSPTRGWRRYSRHWPAAYDKALRVENTTPRQHSVFENPPNQPTACSTYRPDPVSVYKSTRPN